MNVKGVSSCGKTLTGVLSGGNTLKGTLSNKHLLSGTLNIARENVAPVYEGDYVVTPSTTQQILATKQKLLVEDVTVNSIPYYEVSNTSGGETVYIGKEV